MKNQHHLKNLFDFYKGSGIKHLQKYEDYNDFREKEFKINIEYGSEEAKKRHQEFFNSLNKVEQEQFNKLFELK